MMTATQTPITAAPLRSYLFMLTPRAPSRGGSALIHYVVEESPERAIQVCDQAYPGLRIVSVRDVTNNATAA
jgi:hypothetical protein